MHQYIRKFSPSSLTNVWLKCHHGKSVWARMITNSWIKHVCSDPYSVRHWLCPSALLSLSSVGGIKLYNPHGREKMCCSLLSYSWVNPIKRFLLIKQLTKAEIIWHIDSVMRCPSFRRAPSTVKAMKTMFTDSDIIQKIEYWLSVTRMKVSYLIGFGLLQKWISKHNFTDQLLCHLFRWTF